MKKILVVTLATIMMTMPVFAEAVPFEDVEVFSSSDQNYRSIFEYADEGKTDELKLLLEDYKATHPQSIDIDSVIEVLDMYGYYSGVIKETDAFTGYDTVYYDGCSEITDDIHVLLKKEAYTTMFLIGFIKDNWLFAEDAKLRILNHPDTNKYILMNPSKFNRDVLDGGRIKEVGKSSPYDSDFEYLLSDMSGDVVIRFDGDEGTLDFTLSDLEKTALQNMSKYFLLRSKTYDAVKEYRIKKANP